MTERIQVDVTDVDLVILHTLGAVELTAADDPPVTVLVRLVDPPRPPRPRRPPDTGSDPGS